MKTLTVPALALGTIFLHGVAVAQQESTHTVSLHISAQPIADALNEFAHQADLQVVFYSSLSKGMISRPLMGMFTPQAALAQLLADIPLRYEFINPHTVTIAFRNKTAESLKPIASAESAPSSLQDAALSADWSKPDNNEEETKPGFWTKLFRLAQADNKHTEGAPKAIVDNTPLQEIIVTAEKKSERLQDVPVPVSVISAQALTESSQLRLQDYYTKVPSLNVSTGIQSSQAFTIRGLPTSTFLLDDVPLAGVVPDIDPGNIARVEVLRGPQGTLYGANNLGGLVKFVTLDPSTDAVTGRVEAGVNTVSNAYDGGYNVRGSVNLPLTQDLAIRAGAFWRQDAGYIDNPVLHINGINRARADGAQLTALWRPSESWSLRLSALYQDIKGGNTDVDSFDANTSRPLNRYQQSHTAGMGPYDRKTTAYSAVLKAKVGSVDLTSLTGYNVNAAYDYYDLSPPQFGIAQYAQSFFGVSGAPTFTNHRATNISQEIRLSTSLWDKLDVLAGGYYDHQGGTFYEQILAANGTTGAVAGSMGLFNNPGDGWEYAVFGDLTYHFTDRLDVQAGGRASRDTGNAYDTISGPLTYVFTGSQSPFVAPTVHTDSRAVTYLLTPRFKISPDMMIYARLASGFIPGGTNITPDVPPTFGPEKTNDYEIGAKGEVMDHFLSFDVSVYRIDFTGLQLEFSSPNNLSYTANAGTAKSQGIELTLEARPISGLKVAAWVVFSDAKLTEIPEGVIKAGSPQRAGAQLPDSSRFSGNFSVDEEFPLTAGVIGFVGATESYLGEREGPYAVPPNPRPLYPAYAKTDLRAGARFGSWTANLYANNITNRYGLISGDNQGALVNQFYVIQPRTVGLSVARTF